MLDTRYPRLLLLGVALLFIATGIGLKDPWPSDEPRFALVAQEMVDSGRWFFPTRGGELYPDKPPLFMWSQAIVLELSGSIRLASALPSLLSALVVLLVVFAAGQRFWNPRVGLLAGLLLLTTPQFVLEARAGQLDMMVTAWIALGFYGFLRHLRDGPDRRWLFVGFAACGFGVITKGVGFLPLLAFLAWPFLRPGTGRSPALLNVRDALVGVLCILGAIALWLIPMLLLVASSGDPAFEAYRDNILFKQTGERYVAPSHHFQPWWYFLGEVIPSLWFPVFVLLPWLVPAWRRAILGGNRTLPLVLAWAALVVLFFTLSPAKRGVYILPALPWICLAAATELDTLVARPGVRRLALAVGGIAATAGFALGVWLSFAEPERAAGLAARYGFNPTPVPWLVALGAGIATFVAWYRSTPVLAYAGTMLSIWLVLGLVIYPGINDY
ncbi:MAG: glycosyltransferase family 39 protein, partial [Pseudomonadota bacterium]